MVDKKEIQPFAFQESTNIDEHQQIVDKTNEIIGVINDVDLDVINEKVATLESDVSANTASIATIDGKLTADETQIATNKINIESNRDSMMLMSKDIEAIKEVDTTQNTQITALGNADIASVTSAFDTDTRKLTIGLNPKSGDAITTEVTIPGGSGSADVTGTAPIVVTDNNVALNINSSTLKVDDNGQLTVIGGGGGGGGDYSATLPITIADNAIGIAYDDTLTLKDNKLSVVDTGKDYVAGTGITINDATIAVDETVIATKASVDTANVTIAEHTSDIASLEQKYDSQQTAITELSTGVSNAISTANSAKTTADDANIHANTCYNDVAIADNVLTFTTVEGDTKEITLPSRKSISYTLQTEEWTTTITQSTVKIKQNSATFSNDDETGLPKITIPESDITRSTISSVTTGYKITFDTTFEKDMDFYMLNSSSRIYATFIKETLTKGSNFLVFRTAYIPFICVLETT